MSLADMMRPSVFRPVVVRVSDTRLFKLTLLNETLGHVRPTE